MEPRLGQMMRLRERRWTVVAKDSTPWASRVGGELLAHIRFVTLVSIDGPATEITLPESEWHLMEPARHDCQAR